MLRNFSPTRFRGIIRKCVLLILLAVCHDIVFAQQRPYSSQQYGLDSVLRENRKINIIKTNIVLFQFGDLNLIYERLSKNSPKSFVVKLDYNFYTSDEFDLSGITIMPGVRYYLSKKKQAPAGYYVQPTFLYGAFTVVDKTQNFGARINIIGGGIIGGKQWAFGKRFTAEVFLGGVYAKLSANDYKAAGVVESFLIEVGGSMGFRF